MTCLKQTRSVGFNALFLALRGHLAIIAGLTRFNIQPLENLLLF